MTNTENNVAAQAGDEPMRAAFEAWHRSKFATRHSTGQPTRDMHNGIYAEEYGPENQQKMWDAFCAGAQVSPRATADVERDAARYRWLLRNSVDKSTLLPWPIVDWMRGWPIGKPELDEAIDAAIATTKPGA